MTLQDERRHSRLAQAEFDHLTAHIERMWGQLLRGHPHQPQFSPPVFSPPIDVYEMPDAVVVVIELPGMRDHEIGLEVEANELTIRGEKPCRHPAGEHQYSQMEITGGSFLRTVTLPSEVDPQATEVRYDDGYIEIHLARVARRIERRVRITIRER